MASPANNNSSSSPPIPNRPNPKPRNSESGDPLRRSFGGNPFPTNPRVNLPSEFSRRNSFGGRENSSDKENETKAVTTPKGSKNFMSPTISAVSKINPSPRKKVLSDKNELSRSEVRGLQQSPRSCVSFTDITNIIGSEDSSHDMTVTDYDENEVDKGIVYSDPRFRISPRPSVPYTSPEFAGREVGGSLLPPYDPKKNYLSPRPQFLHYKPNPRIEQRFDECKQLDELFVSQSSSTDTEVSTEMEEDDACHKSGYEAEEEEEETEAESDEELVCESIEETSQVPKQSGFRKFRFFGWFLALALGFMLVSATFTPPTGSPFYEFHMPRETKLVEKLSVKLWSLTGSSLVYIDKLVSSLGAREEVYGMMQFHNLTYTLEDYYTVFQPTSVEISVAELEHQEPEEKSQGEYNVEEDGYVNEFEEESGVEENSEVVCETKYGEAGGTNEETEKELGTDIELNEGEGNSEALFEEGIERNTEEQGDSELNHESQEMLEAVSTKKLEDFVSEAIYIDQHNVESDATINVVDQQKESEVAETVTESEEAFEEISSVTSPDLYPNKAIIVLSSTVLVLLAAVAFLFAKKAKPVAASAPGTSATKELSMGHVESFNKAEEVDDRTSNSLNKKSTSSQSKNRDTKSGGKKRRESLASSASEYSVGSFSYGSFTTYEKIPIKSGDREEEMITPVRRSNRLRNMN